ncbi:MAG: hypothetical protein M1823_000095 [Watsoniomyces obsoletus]|nr:MAG: hypothetical protein M1823_000095 [Watsoniomyces obsoletus]
MASRVTRASTTLHLMRALRGVSAQAGPIMTNLSLLSACRQVCRQAALGRRNFWWCRQRTWASRLDPQYQKIIDRRYKTLKHRYAHAVERRKLWDREFSQPHWRWHLARVRESRGLASRWVSMDRVEEQKGSDPTRKPSDENEATERSRCDEAQAGQRHQRPTMEQLKKELDENPYGALFGHRAEYLDRSGPWSPHGMWKSFSSKFGAFPYSGESMTSGDYEHRQRASSQVSRDDSSGSESWAQPTPGSSQDSIAKSFESVSASTDGYEIDPITLRKVDKSTATGVNDEAFDIPVKKSSGHFVPRKDARSNGMSSSIPQGHGNGNQPPKRSKSKGSTDTPLKGEAALPQRPNDPVAAQLEDLDSFKGDGNGAQAWLAQEGFATTAPEAPNSARHGEMRLGNTPTKSNYSSDTRKANVFSPAQGSTRETTKTRAEEESLDQLRPSNIRAAAGIPTKSAETKTTTASPQLQSTRFAGNEERRKAKDLIKEVRQIYEESYGTIDMAHRQPTNPGSKNESTSRVPEQTRGIASTLPTIVDAELVPSKNEPNSVLPTKESNADFETPRLVAQGNPTDLKPLNAKPVESRWQEKQNILNHDVEEIEDFLSNVEQQLDAVVRERRMRADALAESIESKSKPASSASQSSSTVYKVLALDPLTQEISSAIMTSSTAGPIESITSLAEIIPKLRSPARFMAYIGPLQADGFELVSGGGDALVFKQVREPVQSSSNNNNNKASVTVDDLHELDRRAANAYVNPIDGTTMGNFASPTGFVSYNTAFNSPEYEAQTSIPDISSDATRMAGGQSKVTREEPVFSGRQKWQDDESQEAQEGRGAKRGGKVARRILWGGAWVAACSYAVGVVTEFFRTGGSDGTGVEGF